MVSITGKSFLDAYIGMKIKAKHTTINIYSNQTTTTNGKNAFLCIILLKISVGKMEQNVTATLRKQ